MNRYINKAFEAYCIAFAQVNAVLSQALKETKAKDTIVDLKEKLKDIEDATAATYKRKIAAIIREHNRYARQANDAYLKAQEEITKLKEQIANIHGLRTIIQPRRITPDLADRR